MRTTFCAVWDAAADVIFPRSCLGCDETIEGSSYRHLCQRCVSQLAFVGGPCCALCGHPFYGEVQGERICPHCDGLAPAFNRGRTAVLCKGPARALIHELKYRGGLFVLDDMVRIFRSSAAVLEIARDAILVPVPLHPRKARERGFNQSELIAESLAKAAGEGTSISTLLRRVVDTQSQTAFDRRTRLANLKNAFALSAKAGINPSHHYVLVDDVFTTGSTLNSCARVLRHAGCLNLDVVTFGHG